MSNIVSLKRPIMIKRKLDGTVNESSVDQEIRKSYAISVHSNL